MNMPLWIPVSRRFLIIVLAGFIYSVPAFGQFSPGDLSKAHQSLEGLTNCAQCHEVGTEISGAKCAACHSEIRTAIATRSGFHALNGQKKCIACHKEHLGKDAATVQFNAKTFDHKQTGYSLTGKHNFIECVACHATKNIKDQDVLNIVRAKGRTSFLGLQKQCLSCHQDHHKGTMGSDCQTCHTTLAFAPASLFDHNKTRFVLTGLHTKVECKKCHSERPLPGKEGMGVLGTKSFVDCAPCHASPHKDKFAAETCKSCHATSGWIGGMAQRGFDHNRTGFKLVGRHTQVRCQECHGVGKSRRLKLEHNRCTDCHKDEHKGEFLAKFRNDCEQCHTVKGFVPSTFTFIRHQTSRFPLTGAHEATACLQCHQQPARKTFAFRKLECKECHDDPHRGKFASQKKGDECSTCHATESWKPKTFDHSKFAFTLVGKHLSADCRQCHKLKEGELFRTVGYKGAPQECESCHKEVHDRQFASGRNTNCAACHQPFDWKARSFDHNKARFQLTGGHKKVECRLCHPTENRTGNIDVVRYKPLEITCESCHQGKDLKRG